MADRLTLYHNPRCSTSRKVLALVEAAGRPFDRVDYLVHGWTQTTLKMLCAALGVSPLGLLRTKEPLAGELGLLDPRCTDDAILAAMIAHPVLVERPILVSGTRGAVCRPPERALALLAAP